MHTTYTVYLSTPKLNQVKSGIYLFWTMNVCTKFQEFSCWDGWTGPLNPAANMAKKNKIKFVYACMKDLWTKNVYVENPNQKGCCICCKMITQWNIQN